MLKTTLITAFIALFISTANAAELKKFEGEAVAPALILTSLDGKEISLQDQKGKVVLLQFWATYCTPCRKEMPSMNKLIKKLEASKTPFKILAVNMGETKDEVQKFVDEVKPEFTILMDEKGENVQAWNVFAAPSNFLIDPKGKIRYTLYGGVDWDADEIVTTIKELAKDQPEESEKMSKPKEEAKT